MEDGTARVYSWGARFSNLQHLVLKVRLGSRNGLGTGPGTGPERELAPFAAWPCCGWVCLVVPLRHLRTCVEVAGLTLCLCGLTAARSLRLAVFSFHSTASVSHGSPCYCRVRVESGALRALAYEYKNVYVVYVVSAHRSWPCSFEAFLWLGRQDEAD